MAEASPGLLQQAHRVKQASLHILSFQLALRPGKDLLCNPCLAVEHLFGRLLSFAARLRAKVDTFSKRASCEAERDSPRTLCRTEERAQQQAELR